MPRARDPNRDKAYDIYKQNNGLIELVDIAKELNVPDGTIRGWKNKDHWDDKFNGTFHTETNGTERKKKKKADPIPKKVKNLIENSELTDKQKLFCLYFSKSFNATQSYLKAYGCSYATALTEGPALKNNPRIALEINKIKKERYTKAFLKEEDIFQKYMDIAFADITDYMMFDNEKVTYIDDEGNQREALISHVNVRSDKEVDGTIINEVSKGKDGVKIKLADRMKALDWLAEHMNMATEEQKARIEALRAKSKEETVNTDIVISLEGDLDEWGG